MTGLDDGTRITVEVEGFLRLARAGDADRCAGLLAQTPELIDSVEAGGFAALHFAAFYGHVQLLRLLIEKKANLELKNYDYNTPLMLAAKGRQHEAIKILVAAGAKINATGKGGTTAVHHAAGMGYIDTVRELIALGAKVSGEKADTGSPLHWAAHSGNVSMLGVLLFEMRVPIDCIDGHGGTPLFTAVFSKHSDAARFLLENGADVNHATNDNSTVLHIAAAQGKLEDIKMLLMFGAKAEATDNDGDTPMKLAEGKKEVLTELAKPAMTAEKRAEESARLKAHGNKVFAEGENNKAARLYTQAIALEKTNHVYFSNRSACYFNTQQYQLALFDALRCIELAPQWPKGFLRKAATLKALKQYDSALEACAAGLALDAGNADLETVRKDILAIKGSQ